MRWFVRVRGCEEGAIVPGTLVDVWAVWKVDLWVVVSVVVLVDE